MGFAEAGSGKPAQRAKQSAMLSTSHLVARKRTISQSISITRNNSLNRNVILSIFFHCRGLATGSYEAARGERGPRGEPLTSESAVPCITFCGRELVSGEARGLHRGPHDLPAPTSPPVD
jgi:hypothetical protein